LVVRRGGRAQTDGADEGEVGARVALHRGVDDLQTFVWTVSVERRWRHNAFVCFETRRNPKTKRTR
jgi:hypothetical protein